jgi:hypothetical protein
MVCCVICDPCICIALFRICQYVCTDVLCFNTILNLPTDAYLPTDGYAQTIYLLFNIGFKYNVQAYV